MGAKDHYPRVEIRSRKELREWLMQHHTTRQSVWIVTWKKRHSGTHVSWPEIVDEALCFGWIDSVARKCDEERTMLLLSPRKKGSVWSDINKAKVEKLTAAGLMTTAGQSKIDAAKADGSWDFLTDIDQIPEDLAAAFAPGARENFDAFPRSARCAILYWLKSAKTPATRTRRIAEITSEAAHNRRANQYNKS